MFRHCHNTHDSVVMSSHFFGSLSQAQSVSSAKEEGWLLNTHSITSCYQIDRILEHSRKRIFHLDPTKSATPLNFCLKRNWASWLWSIHNPQNNLGASYHYLGWDFKQCYLISFNFEWDFLSNTWCTCSKWEWKEYFTAWRHPKNAPKLSTLQLNIDRSEEKTSK